MDIQSLFTVACIVDMERAEGFYTTLIGRGPDDRPMEGLVQWRGLAGASLQIVRDADRAGSSRAPS